MALALIMRDAGIPEEELQAISQIEQQSVKKRSIKYAAECIGTFKLFLENPPDGAHVFSEQVVCTPDRLLIVFASKAAVEQAAVLRLESMLMDLTFSTNKEGLLLGAVWPVGLTNVASKPTVRFLLQFFVLADAEDEEAIREGIRLFRT